MIVAAEDSPEARGALIFRTCNMDMLENRDKIHAAFPEDNIVIRGPLEGFRDGLDVITE